MHLEVDPARMLCMHVSINLILLCANVFGLVAKLYYRESQQH